MIVHGNILKRFFFLLIACPYYCPFLFPVSGILKCSSVKSLSQADSKEEENPKNENSSPCLVICVLDHLSGIFALSSPNFVLKERFSCVTEDLCALQLYGESLCFR